jgi:serine/threonine-protein kinase
MARRFRILGTLGRGAFGEVHLAEIHGEDGFVQTLAVKWLHRRHAEDPEIAGRLRDEARLLGLLDHPNIVRVQGLTTLDGRLAILMEPVHGIDLGGQHLPVRAAAEVACACADALDAAWSTVPPGRTEPLRVVHRDIKPSNVMVTPRGQVKVMDFGVARATFAAREVETRSQQYGTARYMAPERWLDGVAEAPSDVFSLGITTIELLTGQAGARPRLSREGFATDVQALLDGLPTEAADLAPLLARMVAFAPADRPTAAEVVVALQRARLPGSSLPDWAAGHPVASPETTALTGTVVAEDTGGTYATEATSATWAPTATAAVPANPPASPPAPWRRSAPVAAGLVLIALLGGVAWTTRSPRPRPSVAPAVQPTIPELAPEDIRQPLRTRTPAIAPPDDAVAAPRPVAPATPAPPAPAEPVVPTIPVTFVVDPGVTASTPHGDLTPGRRALVVPAGALVRLSGEAGTGPFACTLPIGTAPTTWHVRADGRCLPR